MQPGTRLGPYEIVALLGAGGMGEVYRARDTRLDRDVALKVIHSRFAADADRLSRFEQEAKAAARLDHPNILVVHDVGSHEGSPYIVSELLEGESLREMLGAPLPPRKAVEYALEIARGLSAAHEKGIIHRDLKPENVFVTKDGRIKILDFGVAKLTQPSSGGPLDTEATTAAATEPGVVLGTVGYMSPEQVQGRPLDARSDLFSLGAVLYEMLSGKRPFHRGTAPETLTAILREEPPDLAEMNRNIPPELERIVRHCLEKEPDRRFQSARRRHLRPRGASRPLRGEAGGPDVGGGSLPAPAPRGRGGRGPACRPRPRGRLVVEDEKRARRRGKRLAVLPFENLTGDPEQAYLADGIHESLITDLARLSGFSRVIARPSVMSVREDDEAARGDRERAGGRHARHGLGHAGGGEAQGHGAPDQRGDGGARLVGQLRAGAPRHPLASERDRPVAIAQKAKLSLTPAEQTRLAAARPVSPEAYEAYLKGKFQLNKMTPEGFEKALAYLNQAAEMDPTNPLPQAALALAYARSGTSDSRTSFPSPRGRSQGAESGRRAAGGDVAGPRR